MKIFSMMILICLLASGCANIHIHENDGTISTQREFGVLKIGMIPKTGAQSVTLRGVGLVSTPLATSIGVHTASFVALPEDDCRLVVYADNDEQLSHFKNLLGSYDDICTVSY